MKVLLATLGVGLVALVGQRFCIMQNRIVALETSLEDANTVPEVPPDYLPFALNESEDEEIKLADYADRDVVLLYFHSDTGRDSSLETWLTKAEATGEGRVAVLGLRQAASSGSAGEALSFQTTVDADDALADVYNVDQRPALVVLKRRPIYHTTVFGEESGQEAPGIVQAVLQAEDLQENQLLMMKDNCGAGGCGAGGCGMGPGGPGECGEEAATPSS